MRQDGSERAGAPGPALQSGLGVLVVFLKFYKIRRAEVRLRRRVGLSGPGPPGADRLPQGQRNRTLTWAAVRFLLRPRGGRPAPHPPGPCADGRARRACLEAPGTSKLRSAARRRVWPG